MGMIPVILAVDKVKVDGEQQEPLQEVLQNSRWKGGCTLPWVHRWVAGFPRFWRQLVHYIPTVLPVDGDLLNLSFHFLVTVSPRSQITDLVAPREGRGGSFSCWIQ